MECTCASDIQVAGMLIHFIITAGKHVYGDDTREILKNLEKAVPKFSTTDLELQDLLTWMLMFFPNERPTVQQVFSYVLVNIIVEILNVVFIGMFIFGASKENGNLF